MNVTGVVPEATGAVVERYMYAAYGEATVLDEDWDPVQGNESAVANDRLFTGSALDSETGLYSSRVRDTYHPTLGRWLERDPAGYVEGMNLYEYVGSNPANLTDPMGLCGGTAPHAAAIGPAGSTAETGATGPGGDVDVEGFPVPIYSSPQEDADRLGCELAHIQAKEAQLDRARRQAKSDYEATVDWLMELRRQAAVDEKNASEALTSARSLDRCGQAMTEYGRSRLGDALEDIVTDKLDPVKILRDKAVDEAQERGLTWLFGKAGKLLNQVLGWIGKAVGILGDAKAVVDAKYEGDRFTKMGENMQMQALSESTKHATRLKESRERYEDFERQIEQQKLDYYDKDIALLRELNRLSAERLRIIQEQRRLRGE